ncbi:MAG TPA: DNA repair protein RecO [Candidatus Omnitrophota bacterium]|nr:DNA repair protein RecO [Candidatus Omnitrophota bacterium]HPN56498.1 DNA repair protein RecO [Candidatus Omnitrophota bacterium]
MIIKTKAIVLKSFDFRETSRIATFFTEDEGKVSGVLKGIRKDYKKFGSSVEKFSINDIVYYQYRNSDLHLVSQCDLSHYFPGIREDLKKSLAANYILELVAVVMPVESPNPDIYRLMRDFLLALETAEDVNQLVYVFQIKLLSFSGFRPHLDACLKCRRTISGRVKFSPLEGGLICPQCSSPDPNARMISQGTVASILHVENSAWEGCLRLKYSPIVQKELKYILNMFLVFHLGKKIRSAKYVLTTQSV